ncbi:Crp/Fnr family transcriptional regulator [uncultured Sunxiuqinia sp.]|uniref:Crp/Fnr family transcriptional regulator n=1 Tax=uncultured Sunxiuqinia sp. TaxID=1573825 RepID=UPI00260E31F4|nr:Crp/Fnr family transcriptional regulator [uncultured Sunxiuqinia sp.]
MTQNEIVHTLSQTYSPLSAECRKELMDKMTILSLPKHTCLVLEGQYSDKTFYLIDGCARAYYLKDGKDISDWFAFENEFISSIISFFTDTPSPHYIELLEDSTLVALSKDTIDGLSNQYHDFERLIRVVVTQTMLRQRERISSILFHTASQRYAHILTRYPNITRRIPLTHIASYLGITLETLSRIRNPKS